MLEADSKPTLMSRCTSPCTWTQLRACGRRERSSTEVFERLGTPSRQTLTPLQTDCAPGTRACRRAPPSSGSRGSGCGGPGSAPSWTRRCAPRARARPAGSCPGRPRGCGPAAAARSSCRGVCRGRRRRGRRRRLDGWVLGEVGGGWVYVERAGGARVSQIGTRAAQGCPTPDHQKSAALTGAVRRGDAVVAGRLRQLVLVGGAQLPVDLVLVLAFAPDPKGGPAPGDLPFGQQRAHGVVVDGDLDRHLLCVSGGCMHGVDWLFRPVISGGW
jgi:hypothetical protein